MVCEDAHHQQPYNEYIDMSETRVRILYYAAQYDKAYDNLSTERYNTICTTGTCFRKL